MSQVDRALQALLGWFQVAFGLFLTIFGVVNHYLREFLLKVGVSSRLQTVVILVAAVLFIAAVFRLFNGAVRLLLIVFLILLILRVLAPLLGF